MALKNRPWSEHYKVFGVTRLDEGSVPGGPVLSLPKGRASTVRGREAEFGGSSERVLERVKKLVQ